MTETEKLAYVAGLVDGEGCIMLNKLTGKRWAKRTDYELIIRISNTNKKLLEWIINNLKIGKLYTSNRFKSNNKFKVCYTWQVAGKKAEEFLKLIYEFLVIKKFRADIALEFRETKDNMHKIFYRIPKKIADKREELYRIMKLVNSKGKELSFLQEIEGGDYATYN